jgi:hypothetical protein
VKGMNEKQVMYADVINGVFDMTIEDVESEVRNNPFFTNPDENCIIGDDGTAYTGNDLMKMFNVENGCENVR